ncbi:MAG: hypothetical protein AB7F91_10460 [Parvularculaceae bacterium]
MNQSKKTFLLGAALTASIALAGAADAAPSARAQKVFDFWTAERVAQAKPRDLVIDNRGYAYMRGVDGSLAPYGHSVRALKSPAEPKKGKPGGSGGGIVKNAPWTAGGTVQTAAGRILFEMGGEGSGDYYVCSGTAATDSTSGRSVIISAAHCVYDDAAKVFATNVLFIPNQAGTTGTGTDSNCNNDPLGCWAPAIGVVDVNWTTRTFPANIPWDYAYYVVSDTGAHSGNGANGALDQIAGSLPIDFLPPNVNDGNPGPTSLDFTHALGYSYSDDPNFMYCAEDMTTEGPDNWWLASCGLSGGSSGGPWVQPMNTATGTGPIISVNSWSYTRGKSGGMAGPFLSGTSAACLFNVAKSANLNGGGVAVNPGAC